MNSTSIKYELTEQFINTPILIVDDLEDNRVLLEQMLSEQGFRNMLQAASGAVALQILEQRSDVGLILLDLMMPGMDGYEVARRAGANPKTAHIPIIVVTGGALRRDEALMKSFLCGAMDFIPKPVGEIELYARAKSALTLYHEHQASERKGRELAESHQRYELAVNGVNDGIWDINFVTGEAYYSPNWKKMLGYEDKDIVNRLGMWEKIVHPEDLQKTLAIIHEHWEKRTPFYESEHRLRAKNGEYIWIQSRGRALWDENGKVIRMTGTTTNIMHRRAVESQLRHAQHMESLGRLAAGIAHDFNNLLTTIMGQVHVGRLNLPAGSPVLASFTTIEKNAMEASEFCQKMLAYAGMGCYATGSIDLNDIVAQAVNIFKETHRHNDMVRVVPSAQPLPAQADAAQMRHMLLSLLVNSLEAIGDDDGRITIRCKLANPSEAELQKAATRSTQPGANYVQLEIQDDGCGMTAAVRDKVFDPFFTTKTTGRGLGLCAVLGIVKAHDGVLHLASQPNQGCTVRIWLKLSSESISAPAPPNSPEDWRGSGTLLLVEDEPDIRDIASLMFQELGFETLLAESGERGVEIFRAHHDRIRLVVLDWNMPGMNGEETFLALRKISPSIPVLVATGYSEQEAFQRFKGQERTGFLPKPYRFADLVKQLRACLP